MKTRIVIAIVTPILFLLSCNEVDKLLTFSVTNQSSFTIASGFPLNSPIDIPTPDVTTNSTTQFSNNGTRADLVKDVKLKELKLTVINPAGKTFSFLKSVQLYISTNANDEILLASYDNVNTTSNNINLICTGQKLDNYIRASSYKLRAKITTKETLSQNVDVQIDSRFSVVADPL